MKLIRPFSFSWSLVTAASLLSTMIACAGGERPNILFILADDISYRNVGCYEGSQPWARTPNIDSLARGGVRFSRGYAGAWCIPSRATLMTGRQQYANWTFKLHITDYPKITYDPKKMPLWPEALRANGYHTGMIGKWHSGIDAGWGRAWDHQKVWNRCLHPENAHAYYEAEMIETDGGEAEMVEGYPTDFYTDWAVDYIQGKNRSKNQPWFLWLCYGTAHGPFTPAERDRGKFPNVKAPIPADIYPPRIGKPSYHNKVATWTKGDDGRPKMAEFHTPKGSTVGMYGDDLSDWERQYQQTISALDENIARLLRALEATGQRKNTLIVFTADQGFAWGQHGFATKLAPYDANIRPPLIFNQPGTLPANTVCRHPVTGADIVSTLMAQSQTEEPWKMHGHDFSPLLRDPGRKEWEHGALLGMTGIMWGENTSHMPRFIKHTQHVPWWVSYSKGPYKYIRTLEENEIEELYDVEKDPEELNNLALNPAFHPMIAEFRATAEAELKRTEAPFVKKLPPVFPLDDTIAERADKTGSRYRSESEQRPFLGQRILEMMTHPVPPFHLD